MNAPLLASLQNKLTFGYLLVAMLTLAVSLYTFEEIRVLEQRVLLGERVTELFDTALEIRRFERNYFLHGQEADRLENARYLDTLRRLLDTAEADFVHLGISDSVGSLRAGLTSYGQLMQQYVRTDPRELSRRSVLEAQIRAAGKHIVGIAETAAGTERNQVRSLLASFRVVLVVTIVALALLMIGIGQVLSRRVVQPLKRMEEGVAAIQNGKRDQLPLPSDDRELIAVVGAFNQLLRELEQRQRHMLRAEKLAALGTMLSGVAHELNNPLSNIWSSCQILIEELNEADTEAQRELLLQVDDQCERARNIVRSLLDFARDQPIRMQPVVLPDLVNETLSFLKAEVPTEVRIKVEVPADLILVADRQRLQQVCLNLIKNAVQAVGNTGLVSISARHVAEGEAFPVACPVQGAAVDLFFSDSGPGIASEVLPRIFDPFFTTKDVGHGMGLGLFIVREIVEQHAGCITVESEPGRFTTFHIRLPHTSATLTEHP
jgi:signal transduction histidine kinase